MSPWPSFFFLFFIVLPKASSNRFSSSPMTLGARSLPKFLPTRISIPPFFPSTPDVMGRTASSYATRFQPLEEIHTLASPSSLRDSQSPSQSHNVFCLRTLKFPNRAHHWCASRIFFFLVLLNVFFEQSPSPSGQSNVVSPCPEIVAILPHVPQTSALWLLDTSLGIHIDSQSRPDGFSDVIVTSNDGSLSITLDPICTFSLLYPGAK